MTDHLLIDHQDGITTLTMNRPKVLNALSLDMRHAMFDAMDEIEHDPKVRCVVLKGAGGNFMAGGDVKSFAEDIAPWPAEKRTAYFERRVHSLHPMMMQMRRMNKPILASVEGAAAGAGMSFMMACDLAICATNSIFRFAYSAIGASPDGTGSYNLPRIVGTRRAMELALLGDKIDAETAHRYNLVNFLVAPEDIEAETNRLATRLASGPTVSYGSIKELIYASHANTFESQLAMEARNFGKCAGTEDWVEGVTAFAEKRPAAFKGK
ncbi:enoyl-CoA hydratase/isomerase family protein [Labrenzia sp. PHM005]|uniref:enoyl-CoA hydratase/isomerase family protein n=1 Tax=Labrenzia sp. PHM005 TaxID=2590016 RepID=UPI0011404788|nr:enoyl-CoA hydratase-related protein [Labrenzia sp. PHM005]QDG78858.1 enoyl-CoA hydratase [Labrenzia sp. PHM005]